MKALEKNQLLIDSLEKKVQEWRELAKVDKHAMSLRAVCGILSPELEYLIQESWSNQDIVSILTATLANLSEEERAEEFVLESQGLKEYDLKGFMDEFHDHTIG